MGKRSLDFLGKTSLQSLYGGENAYLVSEYLGALSSAGLKVTKVIPTFASPINYSPMTEIQLVLRCTRHLSILIGEDRVKKSCKRDKVWRFSNNTLDKIS